MTIRSGRSTPRARRPWAGLAAAIAAAALVGGTAPAMAGTQNTMNTCLWSDIDRWREMDVYFTGNANTAETAPGGAITLGGGNMYTELYSWIPQFGGNTGALMPGDNAVPIRAWLALEGSNTQEGVRVVETTGTMNVRVEIRGGQANGPSPEVRLDLPDTAWTAGGHDRVEFRQAGPGHLPGGVPGGRPGMSVNPTGSLYVRAELPHGGVVYTLDCRPGTYERHASGNVSLDGQRPVAPGTRADGTPHWKVFEAVTVAGGDPAPPAPPAPPVAPAPPGPPAPGPGTAPARPRVAATAGAIRATRTTVRVPLRNRGAALGRGRIEIRSANPVRLSARGPARRVVVARAAYRLAAGRAGAVTLRLTANGRKLVAQRRTTPVRIVITPAGAKATTRNGRLTGPAPVVRR